MCINLWITVCLNINVPFPLKFCLGYCLASPSYFKTFKTGVTYKRLAYKKRANSKRRSK